MAAHVWRPRPWTPSVYTRNPGPTTGELRIVARESGRTTSGIPIFSDNEGTMRLTGSPPSTAVHECSHITPGGLYLTDLLSRAECKKIVDTTERFDSWSEDAPVSLGRDVRRNSTCVWIASDELNDAIFERARRCLPPTVGGSGPIAGLNARWRLYRYHGDEGDVFRPHTDGSWPGSGIVDGQLLHDRFCDGRWSRLTFLMYLNDDFEGGETSFFTPVGGRWARSGAVGAIEGSALVFPHGEASPLHEGSLVTRGTKYVARTDVLYHAPSL
mmetsp:Transcript_23112/g.75354  ORF Transcript_23112/g.75354 Transcript_23112/m.75354 type:complete len:271 (+) Transcript_23112:18-830(+)